MTALNLRVVILVILLMAFYGRPPVRIRTASGTASERHGPVSAGPNVRLGHAGETETKRTPTRPADVYIPTTVSFIVGCLLSLPYMSWQLGKWRVKRRFWLIFAAGTLFGVALMDPLLARLSGAVAIAMYFFLAIDVGRYLIAVGQSRQPMTVIRSLDRGDDPREELDQNQGFTAAREVLARDSRVLATIATVVCYWALFSLLFRCQQGNPFAGLGLAYATELAVMCALRLVLGVFWGLFFACRVVQEIEDGCYRDTVIIVRVMDIMLYIAFICGINYAMLETPDKLAPLYTLFEFAILVVATNAVAARTMQRLASTVVKNG